MLPLLPVILGLLGTVIARRVDEPKTAWKTFYRMEALNTDNKYFDLANIDPIFMSRDGRVTYLDIRDDNGKIREEFINDILAMDIRPEAIRDWLSNSSETRSLYLTPIRYEVRGPNIYNINSDYMFGLNKKEMFFTVFDHMDDMILKKRNGWHSVTFHTLGKSNGCKKQIALAKGHPRRFNHPIKAKRSLEEDSTGSVSSGYDGNATSEEDGSEFNFLQAMLSGKVWPGESVDLN
jgi:hypothetical protein